MDILSPSPVTLISIGRRQVKRLPQAAPTPTSHRAKEEPYTKTRRFGILNNPASLDREFQFLFLATPTQRFNGRTTQRKGYVGGSIKYGNSTASNGGDGSPWGVFGGVAGNGGAC